MNNMEEYEKDEVFLFLKKLNRILSADYGKSNKYSAMQVFRALERSSLDLYYLDHAIVVFAKMETISRYQELTGNDFDQEYVFQKLKHLVGHEVIHFRSFDFIDKSIKGIIIPRIAY
jgi:hypothetical protein